MHVEEKRRFYKETCLDKITGQVLSIYLFFQQKERTAWKLWMLHLLTDITISLFHNKFIESNASGDMKSSKKIICDYYASINETLIPRMYIGYVSLPIKYQGKEVYLFYIFRMKIKDYVIYWNKQRKNQSFLIICFIRILIFVFFLYRCKSCLFPIWWEVLDYS